MEENQEKRIETILTSLKGSQRAKPPAELWAKIENQVLQTETQVMPIYHLRIAVAAAAVLLALNVFSFIEYNQANSLNESELIGETEVNPPLISNYNLYD